MHIRYHVTDSHLCANHYKPKCCLQSIWGICSIKKVFLPHVVISSPSSY